MGQCGRPVVDALVVAHPGEGDGGVEGNPTVRGEPVQKVVQLLPQQERLLVHQVAHLHKRSNPDLFFDILRKSKNERTASLMANQFSDALVSPAVIIKLTSILINAF